MPQQVSGFSKLSKTEKINWLITNYFGGNIHAKVTLESYWNSDSELQQLHDEFIENTITNFYMPFGIAPNFLINEKLYTLPMTIEESSVVAAASKAAGILKAGSKIGLGALKFAGPVGLAVTAGLGVFDGVQAGMESFKKDGKVGKAIQEGTAGLLSSLTLGIVSQEQISGGMSKIGNMFKRRQKYGAGADDYEKVDLQADKQNQLAMNKSELLRFTQDPEAYMEEVNKGRGKGGKGKKLSPIQVRNQLLDNIKSNKRDLKDLGLSGGTLETTGSMMDSNLMQLKTTGMTAEQIIQQGMSDRSKGIKDTAPIIINNDSSVRSNSTTNTNVNETITHRDGLMVSATSDF